MDRDLFFPDGFIFILIVTQDALGAAFGERRIAFRQPFPVFGHLFSEAMIFRQIVPLMRILPEIIKFFGTVRITDVAIPFAAYAMVARIVRGERGTFARRLRILKLRQQTEAFEIRPFRQAAEIDERGLEVKQVRRLCAALPASDTRSRHNQRHARAFGPKRVFTRDPFLA